MKTPQTADMNMSNNECIKDSKKCHEM